MELPLCYVSSYGNILHGVWYTIRPRGRFTKAYHQPVDDSTTNGKGAAFAQFPHMEIPSMDNDVTNNKAFEVVFF